MRWNFMYIVIVTFHQQKMTLNHFLFPVSFQKCNKVRFPSYRHNVGDILHICLSLERNFIAQMSSFSKIDKKLALQKKIMKSSNILSKT